MKIQEICLSLCLVLIISPVIHTQSIQRKYMDLEDVKEIIMKETQGMREHNKFFFSTNIYYVMCKPKIQAAVDALDLDEEDGIFFCKMIENIIPDYFMNVFMISASSNNRIMNDLIKEFFKVTHLYQLINYLNCSIYLLFA